MFSRVIDYCASTSRTNVSGKNHTSGERILVPARIDNGHAVVFSFPSVSETETRQSRDAGSRCIIVVNLHGGVSQITLPRGEIDALNLSERGARDPL